MTDFSNCRARISDLSRLCVSSTSIDPALYSQYDVKRGLRDLNGNGVLTGLTEISEINSFKLVDGVKTPCEGSLYYRGYSIRDLIRGADLSAHSGFEETVYLLLFGKLPAARELEEFKILLADLRQLPGSFARDVVMKAANPDIMNSVSKSVLTLYNYDKNANDLAIDNVLRQCLHLISVFPMLCVYGYHAYNYYKNRQSLFFHAPENGLSTAENILYMLRPDSRFTALEANVLD
ncbi:MAG: citrate synthase, partial [Clostridia bacterium]|nr:citrate synthase [Clostridia bacterium]